MAPFLATHAAAQGTDGRLPDPINADDLTRYATTLRLSAEQVAAAERFLEEYRDQFKLLRDGEIDRALALNMHEFAARESALLGRIAALDEAFFHSIEPILSDDQHEVLPYVRLVRQRERYMAIVWMRNLVGGALPDLALLLDELDLPQHEREAIDTMMPAYQQRIISGLRGIHELSVRLRAAEQGKADPNDAARLAERVKEIRRYNRQMARTLAQSIANEEQSLRLHRRFFRFAYGHAFQLIGRGLLPNYDGLLRSADLTDEDREAILAMRREALARQTRLLEDAANVIDDVGIVFTVDEQDAYMDIVSSLHERGRELRESLQESVRTRFGDLPEASDEPTYTMSVSMSMHPGNLLTRRTMLARTQPPSPQPAAIAPPDQFIPPAISEQDVRRFARLLGLDVADDDVQAALDAVHQSYLDRYAATIRPMKVELSELRMRADTASHQTFLVNIKQSDEPAEEDPELLVEEEYDLRAQCLRTLMQFDSGFFDSLAGLLDRDHDEAMRRIARLRFERLVHTYSRGQWRWGEAGPSGPNRSAFEDIIQLAERHLSFEQQARIAPALEMYREQLLTALRSRYQAMMDRQKAASLLHVSLPMDVDGYIRRQQAVRHAHHHVTRLNQRTVDEIVEDVGWNDGWPLLDAFQRNAYPEAFTDPAEAEPFLAAAFALHDLRAEQRERLDDVAADFRPAYAAVREAIIRLCADYLPDLPGDMVYGEPKVTQAEREFNKELERLKFERETLNRSALRRIRAALNEAQHQRIGAPQ